MTPKNQHPQTSYFSTNIISMKKIFALGIFTLSFFNLHSQERAQDWFEMDSIDDTLAEDLKLTPLEDMPSDFRSNQDPSLPEADFQESYNHKEDVKKASVVVIINKATPETSSEAQKMWIYVDGQAVHEFDISTGKEVEVESTSGKIYVANTPVGYYRPKSLYPEYTSRTWTGANMPQSIFINNDGIAIHITRPDLYYRLGERASGGCIRMREEDSNILWPLVLESGQRACNKDRYVEKDATITFREQELPRTRYYIRDVEKNRTSSAPFMYFQMYKRVSGLPVTGRFWRTWDTMIVVKNFGSFEKSPTLVEHNKASCLKKKSCSKIH